VCAGLLATIMNTQMAALVVHGRLAARRLMRQSPDQPMQSCGYGPSHSVTDASLAESSLHLHGIAASPASTVPDQACGGRQHEQHQTLFRIQLP
jgi:hypothetical protein